MDEGFAGGVCRCPYCREIVLVGRSAVPAAKARPLAPSARPESPDEPAAAPDESPVMAEILGQDDVPMANPVRLQGILTLVMLGLLVAMIGGAIFLAISFSNRLSIVVNPDGTKTITAPDGTQTIVNPDGSRVVVKPGDDASTSAPAPVQVNPFSTPVPDAGATVAGLKIAAPVIYCIEWGGGMKELFDYARFMTRVSIRSLKDAEKFNIYLSCQGEDRILGGEYHGGGAAGDLDGAKGFLEAGGPSGHADVKRTVLAAIDKKPRTVVLLTHSAVADAAELISKANALHVGLVVVGLASGESAAESFANLAKSTGGASVVFTEQDLDAFTQKAPPLD